METTLELHTQDLILRRGRVEDAHAMHKAALEVWHDLQLWMSWAFEGAQSEEAMQAYLKEHGEGEAILGFCKTSGRFVISSGYKAHEGCKDEVETGYWVAREFRGQGLATQATGAILRHLFEKTAIHTVHIRHAEGNIPSARVIEKLGFTKTGVTKGTHVRCKDASLHDTHHYVMHGGDHILHDAVEWRYGR